ncbi:MAG: hypothetical protein R3E82_19885 [Pseudomonadales bacterium]
MSLVLCRRLNHRNIELHGDTRGEVIGVLRRNGDYGFVPWLGFIDRVKAQRRGRPVKLLIARVGRTDGISTRWFDIRPGGHVQGCLTERGAFAVIDQEVRIL